MPLLDISNELLLCISENLESERDINALTRTNRHLYSLLNAYLYRRNVQKFGSSALLWAAAVGQELTAQRLLREGANIQATGDNAIGWRVTPLFLAVKNSHEAVVKL